MNRRNFLKSIGLGAVAAVVPAPEAKPEPISVKIEWVQVGESEDDDVLLCDQCNAIGGQWPDLSPGWREWQNKHGACFYFCGASCRDKWLKERAFA